jgi:hypothetical protein
MKVKKILKVFNWLRLLYTMNGAIFGLIIGVLGNHLSGSGSLVSLWYLVPIFICLAIFIFIIETKRKRLINVALRVTTARTESEKERTAKKGLVTFVSLYNPLKSPTAGKLTPEEREKAAIEKNYHILDLENSNLQPVIEAICSHKSDLQHCWLIGTTNTEKSKGSLMYQNVLIEFLQKEKSVKCKFHFGEKYAIPIDDDALICEKTYKMIRDIFDKTPSFGLHVKDVIADFTGGIRSMVAGMVLSCLDRDNDIQLVGTKYNRIAQPEGPLFPIHISFEPEIKTQT